MRSHRLVLLAAVLGGCDFYPEARPGDSGPAGSALDPNCSETVMIPTGNLQGESIPAGAHEDVYGADPTPFAVHLGLPSRDPSISVSMLWRTDLDTLASVVEFGPADTWPEGARQVTGATFTFGGGVVGEGTFRMHEVRLCGLLTPGTSYTYKVGGAGGWSGEYTFTAPGAPGSFDSFRVAIAGDSRGAYDNWSRLIGKMDEAEPDFFLFSGDMVELGANQTEWERWFAASGDILARKHFLAAHGNHEFLAQNYFAMFGLPGNEEWYAVEWGDGLVLTLNDTVNDAEDLETLQPRFLSEELSGTSARWKIANHHQPAYSTCTRHGSDLEVREAWTPAFDAGDVDFVFAGHNHIYERSVPIKGDQEVALGSGTQYIVTGGAGAPLYQESESDWFGAVANPTIHYIIADFSPSGADFVVYELDSGDVIDEWSVPR
jgi:hypothetical protein